MDGGKFFWRDSEVVQRRRGEGGFSMCLIRATTQSHEVPAALQLNVASVSGQVISSGNQVEMVPCSVDFRLPPTCSRG